MERQLPTLEIEGTTFLVDIQQMAIIQKGIPDNIIFFAEIENEDTHYNMPFDLKAKCLADGRTNEKDIVWVTVPRMSQLDPEGMAQKYNVPIEGITDKMDFEIMLENPAIASRMKGKLNIIEIEGHPFYVDFNMWSLRPHNDFSTQGISMEPLHETEEYEFFPEDAIYLYKPAKHELFEPDWGTITELPKDTVIIKFPFLKEMDPVGYAHKFNRPLKDLLLETNFKPTTCAIKRELTETNLPELFKQNKEWMAREKPKEKKNAPLKKRSRGI